MDLRNPLAIIALSPRTGLIHHQLCHAKTECPILFQPQPHSSFNFFPSACPLHNFVGLAVTDSISFPLLSLLRQESIRKSTTRSRFFGTLLVQRGQ